MDPSRRPPGKSAGQSATQSAGHRSPDGRRATYGAAKAGRPGRPSRRCRRCRSAGTFLARDISRRRHRGCHCLLRAERLPDHRRAAQGCRTAPQSPLRPFLCAPGLPPVAGAHRPPWRVRHRGIGGRCPRGPIQGNHRLHHPRRFRLPQRPTAAVRRQHGHRTALDTGGGGTVLPDLASTPGLRPAAEPPGTADWLVRRRRPFPDDSERAGDAHPGTATFTPWSTRCRRRGASG